MTGERLYERLCKSLADEQRRWRYGDRPNLPETPVAWSHLPPSEQRVWNALGRQLNAKAARR